MYLLFPGLDGLTEQAIPCCLAGSKTVNPQAKDVFHSLVMGRPVTVSSFSISQTAPQLLVDVSTPDIASIRQNLVLQQVGEMLKHGGPRSYHRFHLVSHNSVHIAGN